jgi:hypothetical protein
MISLYNVNNLTHANEHYENVKRNVINRIKRKISTPKIIDELLKDLPKIILGKPTVLQRFHSKYSSTTFRISKDKLISIFDYEAFRKKHGMDLISKLDITCCPYCNKNYTSYLTFHKKGAKYISNVLPEFDHFYPRSKYPLLGISFYNLIPSCNFCNSHIKSSADSLKLNLFHPYTQFKNQGVKFKFYPTNFKSLIGLDRNHKFDFSYTESTLVNRSLKKSVSFFGIKEIYESCHSDLIKDIIDKHITYSAKYLKEIEKSFKLDFESAYKILFETNYEDDLLHKRPFSRLKKDIYNDLEIAKYC